VRVGRNRAAVKYLTENRLPGIANFMFSGQEQICSAISYIYSFSSCCELIIYV
jgi:hypothetical protein